MTKPPAQVYQFKITLNDTRPPIWRPAPGVRASRCLVVTGPAPGDDIPKEGKT